MKKIILSALTVIVIGSVIFISCKKKNDSSSITPTYKDEASTGTGNNPNITNVTTTGTISTTSVAMQNSSMTGIGTVGSWASSNCVAGQTCLSISNSSTGTTISVCFSVTPAAGTYQLVNSNSLLTSGPNKCFMTVSNPPSQPTGSNWYSNSGTVTVTVSGTGIIASFSSIACTQTIGSFPVVTVSGQVGCL